LLGNVDLAADELSTLIDDLLEIARLQAGRVELWRRDVDLRDIVSRASESLVALVEARQQHLELNLPQTAVIASVDVERLGRVLRNLIGNAQKYGREGGHIRITLAPPSDTVRLSVADDGPGIPADQQERIFERFYRIGTGGSGSGLGLAIARGLVELHGGRLWVESAPGAGSAFQVSLPLTSESEP
jgi:signal transduction histidine kinase